MRILEYFSNYAILIFLLIIMIVGIKEKKNLFDLFVSGANEGLKIIVKMFPTLLGLMVAVSMLSNSKVLEAISRILTPILINIGIDSEIIPLIMLRPISGSTTMAIANQIMTNYGVDSKAGLIASTIMGATETTIFVGNEKWTESGDNSTTPRFNVSATKSIPYAAGFVLLLFEASVEKYF